MYYYRIVISKGTDPAKKKIIAVKNIWFVTTVF